MQAMEHDRVSAEDFLEWVLSQAGRYELVDGYVIEMMAGAKQSHNVVVSNIVSSLGPQSKPGGCRTTSSDTAVQTLASTIRYPDIVVDWRSSRPGRYGCRKPHTCGGGLVPRHEFSGHHRQARRIPGTSGGPAHHVRRAEQCPRQALQTRQRRSLGIREVR